MPNFITQLTVEPAGGGVERVTALDWINVKDHGATGNGREVADAAITATSATVTIATASFTAADVGRYVFVADAGASSALLTTTVASVNDATTAVLSDHAGTTATGKQMFIGTEDTAAVQAALTAANDEAGGIVYFPPGIYLCDDLTSYGNIELRGNQTSIIRQKPGSARLISVNPGTGGTPDPEANAKNIALHDLTLRGYVDADATFDRHRHLLNMNAVSDVWIDKVRFIGWHGDGIYFGSSNEYGSERHNQRMKVTACSFDGLTRNNRNCISIIDGDDVLIQGNSARRFSRDDMPGFVDVEPKAIDTWAVCRDIRIIGNCASDFKQNFVRVHLPAPHFTTQPASIPNSKNTIQGGGRVLHAGQNRTVTDTSPQNGIMLSTNTAKETWQAFEFEKGISGAIITNNSFEGTPAQSVVGWVNECRHVEIVENDWIDCARADASLIRICFASNVQVNRNRFHNCGLADGTNGILINFGPGDSAATSENIDFLDNIITGTMTTTVSALERSHTLTASTNKARACRNNGLPFIPAHFTDPLAPVTLTDASTIATDASMANHFRVTLTGNRTLGNPTNAADGQTVIWELIQDATGSRTITLGSAFRFGTDISGVTLTTTPSKRDYLGAMYNSAAEQWHVILFARGF